MVNKWGWVFRTVKIDTKCLEDVIKEKKVDNKKERLKFYELSATREIRFKSIKWGTRGN